MMTEQMSRKSMKSFIRCFRRSGRGLTLLEALVALTIFSSILLPVSMFLVEYLKGSSELGESHQVMNLLEEKMELALTRPFEAFPVGTFTDKPLIHEGQEVLDLRPALVGSVEVNFSLKVEIVPLEFSAIADVQSGKLERTMADESMKKFTLQAKWGKKKEHFTDLIAFRGDL
ncbi:MAG: prepilin-type N-terminal cleavage/methylation domain-containing protein [Candidatus Riflebacteria bacterium]|nr:prepilin-type N-terminal cleavage/methylation domain-containing protein [Candidatus Riflebacteria bacterium]